MGAESEQTSVTAIAEQLPNLSIVSRAEDGCMIVSCSGPSDCRNCIDWLYRPILGRMEDSECSGLVIDKRLILCSAEKMSLNLVAETILHYTNRAVLHKLALVTNIEYNKDEQLLLETLYKKGVNIRLFTDIDQAISWAKAYP